MDKKIFREFLNKLISDEDLNAQIEKLSAEYKETIEDYILKYIGKSDNKIVYSRGIKDDIYCLMDYEENIICQVSECSPYFVCAESSIIKLTKKLDIDFNAI